MVQHYVSIFSMDVKLLGSHCVEVLDFHYVWRFEDDESVLDRYSIHLHLQNQCKDVLSKDHQQKSLKQYLILV